jgi:cell division protein FtsB
MSEDRVAELMRVNAELAAEIRSLTAERTDHPRRRQAPAARGLARLVVERDTLAEDLAVREAELEALRAERDALVAERDELQQQNRDLVAEVGRLRTGLAGALRRVRGRLLSR